MAPVVATPIPMRPEPSVPEIHTPPPVARPAPVIQLQPASPAAAESPASTSATATEVLGAPQARPLPVAPAALRPPEPAPPPPAAPAGPGIWEAELPDAPLPGPGPTSDYLPGTYAGEDLPTWKDEPRRSLPEPLQRAVDLVLQEPVTAVAVLAVGLTIVAVIALTCMG